MSRESPGEVTQLLLSWQAGDAVNLQRLMPLVYDDLHRIAVGLMRRERCDHTLQPTALLNELYMRLLRQRKMSCEDRHHFFVFAARLMRNILTDHARARMAQCRGGGDRHDLPPSRFLSWVGTSDEDLLDLNRALDRLETQDPRKARLLELRFYLSCTTEEACEILDISHATAERELRFARAWLFSTLRGDEPAAGSSTRPGNREA
jgi:RNA polymerase sigma factor (TIGR02999 family)